jgi:hypothetical protein
MKKFLFLIIFFSFVIVLAQEITQGPEGGGGGQKGIVVCTQTPCSWQDLAETFRNLIETVVVIAFWVAFLVVAIGAFLVMLGGPKPEWINRGKSMIWTAIIAYALILLSGIIFDIIIEFFSPKFRPTSYFGPQIVLAQTLEPGTFYNPLKEALMSSLKCGIGAQPLFNSQSLGRLFACLFEIIGLLTRVALILLVFAIVASAFYLISAPLFGFKQIVRAKDILIWSIIGLIIILLADIIQAQIERLVK